MFRLLFTTVVLISLINERLPAEEPRVIELTLSPRAIEKPILKYRLLPPEAELKAGNAVPILLRLPWERTQWMAQVFPKLHEWETRTLDAPEWKKFEGTLPDTIYNEMKRAAYRRDAYWEYPIGETPSPYMILLPDVQGLRGFLGYGLSAKIRYHISRGELDQAREGILVGLANSRHLAKTPFLINQLVALAIDRSLLNQADVLLGQPNNPNLYWAFSTLPESLLSLDRTSSLECDLFSLTFPALNDLDRPREAREWNRMARQLTTLLEQLGEIPQQAKLQEDGSIVEQFRQFLIGPEKNFLTRFIKQARADLPAQLGISPEKVAAMSDEEAGMRWYTHLRISRDHHIAAVLALTPREAWPELKKLQAQSSRLRETIGLKGFEFLEPTNMFISTWSLKRKIQMLRIIEAVRHYLATHDGKLPSALDDIQDVSIPLDPLTGQPFIWKMNGKSATLSAPALPADVASTPSQIASSQIEYRLKVK